jgi:putative ABC transport system ATP-binding protein
VKRALLSLRDISVTRASAECAFELRLDSLDVCAGDRIALVGPSGCGKSTLLDIIALVLIPDHVGQFIFSPSDAGAPIDVTPLLRRRDLDALGRIRRLHVGYVLQTGGLLPFVTVAANIELPLSLLGVADPQRLRAMASRLGITAQLAKLPAQLSSGERQRVAIARALVHSPPLVLADEPTAALDPSRSDDVIQMFVKAAADLGATIIVATHDLERVARFGLQPLRHEFLPPAKAGTIASRFVM